MTLESIVITGDDLPYDPNSSCHVGIYSGHVIVGFNREILTLINGKLTACLPTDIARSMAHSIIKSCDEVDGQSSEDD